MTFGPERRGNAYRWRVDARGDVYEFVGVSVYAKRPKLSPKDVDAVPILPRTVFFQIDNLYALVHDCVLTTKCTNCGARAGERCQKNGMPHSYTHWVRRKAAKKGKR